MAKGDDAKKVKELRNVKKFKSLWNAKLLWEDLQNVFIGWSRIFLPMVFYCAWYLSMAFDPFSCYVFLVLFGESGVMLQ